MAKIYSKGTWVDEVLAGDALYEVVDDTGTPIPGSVSTLQNTITAVNALLTALANGAKINLATAVSVAGTPVTAAIMQNIEDGIDDLDTILSLMRSLTTQATAAGTTTLTVTSNRIQEFTGTTTETVQMPDVTTLILGDKFTLINNSTGVVTVNSSGGDLIASMAADSRLELECVAVTGTDETSWDAFSGGGGGIGVNALINGGFRVAQRGTTFNSTTTPANSDDTFLLDRWNLLSDGNDIVDVTQATSATIADPAYYIGLDVKTANKKFGIIQFLEQKDARRLINQAVSLSFKAKITGTTINAIRAAVIAWDGTADTLTSDVVSAWGAAGTNPTLVANWTYENTPAALTAPSTSWQSYSIENISIDTASAKNVAVFIWTDDVTMDVADFLYIADVKLEVGATATAFEHRPFADELALCQRFYQQWGPGISLESLAFGLADTTSVAKLILNYVPKRSSGTFSYSAIAEWSIRYAGGSATVCTNINVTALIHDRAFITLTGTDTPLTTGQAVSMRAVDANSWFAISAEL